MKAIKWIVFALVMTGATSCIPTTYYTAEVTPRKSVCLGGGPTLILDFPEQNPYTPEYEPAERIWGGRIDLQGQLGVSDRLAVTGNLGVYILDDFGFVTLNLFNSQIEFTPFFNCGFQYEFIERPSIAIQAELGIPPGASSLGSVKILTGIDSKKLNREVVTIGLLALPEQGLSLTIHPQKNISVFVGSAFHIMPGLLPMECFTCGIGFKI